MYTDKNYQTKSALVADFKAGKPISTFQPGGFFAGTENGDTTIEGPHFPQAHKWYARVTLRDGVIVKVLR